LANLKRWTIGQLVEVSEGFEATVHLDAEKLSPKVLAVVDDRAP
jgi:hypothetical protein